MKKYQVAIIGTNIGAKHFEDFQKVSDRFIVHTLCGLTRDAIDKILVSNNDTKISLNFDEEIKDAQSGTAFFRSKEFNEEFVSSDKNYRSSRILNKINAYVNFDPSKYKSKDWERYHVEPHEFNTLLLYEGRLWHSPYFRQEGWGTNRLTFNAFLH